MVGTAASSSQRTLVRVEISVGLARDNDDATAEPSLDPALLDRLAQRLILQRPSARIGTGSWPPTRLGLKVAPGTCDHRSAQVPASEQVLVGSAGGSHGVGGGQVPYRHTPAVL